jgi:peptidoglycan hydrolase-like protein with peptidoglycan-binding domain
LPTPKEVFRVYVSPTAQGVRSENVKNLQNYLIANGYLSAGSNSGYYGSQTVAAVLALQQANNISSDGKTVGPKTLAIINGYAKSLVGTQSASQSAISLGNNLPPPCQNGVPSITVLSPNGGEVYSMDDSLPFYRTPITVKWASCGISPNNQPVQIDLVMPQYSFMAGSGFSNFYTLAQVPDNQGIVTVTIPLWYGFTYGNNFKISLSLPNFVGPNPPSDMSDNFFAVTSHVNLIKNPAFSDQTISPNVTHQKIGSYLLQNNSNEPISFNYTNSQGEYLQVDLLDSMTNTTIPINDFSNLEVDLNSVNIELTPPPVARNFIQVFPNNTPIIAPHQTATLDIYVDINTAATGTVQASIPSLAIVGVTTMQNYYVPSYVLGQTTTVGLYAQHGSSH